MVREHLSGHPLTKIVVAISFAAMVCNIPVLWGSIAVLIGGSIVWGVLRPLRMSDPGKIFIRIWFTAGIFLTLMHGLTFSHGIQVSLSGLIVALRNFLSIGSLMVSCLWMARTIKAEEFYSLMIDLHLPVYLIYIVFQVIYLIPKFGLKSKDILIAQQARGFALRGLRQRLQILPLIFSPLFSSMMYELEENAASIAARGLYAPGQKTHLCEIGFRLLDGGIIAMSIIVTVLCIAVLN